MSGSYSMKGTVPADVGRVKKSSRIANGNGQPPLSYPVDPPDDENMNEIIDENIDLTVLMPDGVRAYHQSIEANIPMMDLLVNLAGTYKLNPAAHTLVVQTGDKWKHIDFKANKTIGLLADENQKVSVQIVKKQAEQKVKQKQTVQPFEMTYRFTVNLPQNQKKVLRISPKLLLGEVRQIVCQDKGYDPSHYVFLLPGNPKDVVNDAVSVGDLMSSEINFVSISMLDAAAAKNLSDLAFAASQAGKENKQNSTKDSGQIPAEGQKKAKSRFLSFLGKKEKKIKLQTNSSLEESTSGNRPKKSESFNVRPTTVYTESGELEHFNIRNTTSDLRSMNKDNKTDYRKSTGSSLIPLSENIALTVNSEQPLNNKQTSEKPTKDGAPKKSGKKRAAPPPPQAKPQTVQVEIEVKPKPQNNTEIEGSKPLQDVNNDIPDRVHVKRFHSRNSSDSSGYHELTLSGADSPDGAKLDNLQTTLDTTSINSADHFNGDSGIRDMSPIRSRGHNKGNRKPGSRDSSLDIDKSEGLVPAGKKKKRAPLPPPDVSAQTQVTSNTIAQVQDAAKEAKVIQKSTDSPRSDDELEAIKAMEEVTMKFNIEDSEDEMDSGMRMVDDSSIQSEDLDADLSHRQRPPATFIAPPPPTEPPPIDSEPVDLKSYGEVVTTTDRGVGDDTTASPRSDKESLRTSPVSNSKMEGPTFVSHQWVDNRKPMWDSSWRLGKGEMVVQVQEIPGIHFSSRPDSRSSNSSVNTIEDLSLAFKQTIAMGEEALGLDSDIDDESDLSDIDNAQDELQKEMGEFKYKIEKLADEEQDSSAEPIDQNQSNNSDSSFIVHEKEAETSERLKEPISPEGNRESSEITYEFTIDAVPAEFKNEEMEEDADVYEEEIVEILPADPQVFNADSPRRIPDLDSPKEHKSMSMTIYESFKDEPIDISTPKDSKQETKQDKENKPVEREEFVISLDELSNIDFGVSKPKETSEVVRKKEVPKVNYRIEFRNSRDYDTYPDEEIQSQSVTNVQQVQVMNDDPIIMSDNSNVKNKCSDISFSPDYETEVEHVMEEKSISMIALPAERIPIKDTPEVTNDINENQTYSSATKIVLSQNNSMSSQNSEISPRKEGNLETQNLLQAQYQQLQQQFAMWQGQLVQNQQLLATNQSSVGDDQSNLQLQQLQLQIQMQQQMLLQLQQNMHALTLQNSLAAQQPITPSPMLNQPVILPTSTIQTQSIPVQNQRSSSTVMQTNEMKANNASPNEMKADIPNAPPPPMLSTEEPKKKKIKQRKIKERALEPREQLMLDIRNFGKTNLNKVPVRATKWHK